MTAITPECCEQYWTSHGGSTPQKKQLYGHLRPITKTIKVRRTRHAGHCWRSKDELISDVLRWTPSQGRAKTGRSARTYIQQLFADTGCSPEDLPEAIDDREGWRERVREIRADDATWWWWWYTYIHIYAQTYIYIYIYIYIWKWSVFLLEEEDNKQNEDNSENCIQSQTHVFMCRCVYMYVCIYMVWCSVCIYTCVCVFCDMVYILLFNGISTFLGYLMPNPSFPKNCSSTI